MRRGESDGESVEEEEGVRVKVSERAEGRKRREG